MARDLNDTLIFVKVVEHGSFISAARALRLPKTTVSRKVQDLETRLGAQLLHRTTRKLGLTEAGNVYYEHCQRIARELDEAESAVGQLQGGPRGWLRITAPYSMGIEWIAPLLGEFHAAPSRSARGDGAQQRTARHHRQGNRCRAARRQPARFQPDRAPPGDAAHAGLRQPALPRKHGEPLHPDDLQHHRTLAMNKQRKQRRRLQLAAARRHARAPSSASIRCSSPTIRRRLQRRAAPRRGHDARHRHHDASPTSKPVTSGACSPAGPGRSTNSTRCSRAAACSRRRCVRSSTSSSNASTSMRA